MIRYIAFNLLTRATAIDIYDEIDYTHQGESGRAVRRSAPSAAVDLRWKANVRDAAQLLIIYLSHERRQDDKTAKDFNITAGAVLHLVLALRGGR